ncbi:hypothetical protein DPMN_058116 [Dreissena polymorpha]|uniref:Secernin-3 n=2 Tax=Dreissena polymorpha TaxID=45954 RepID=A0A9D4C170_DREPO|nr:hypothetical protein DPMN_058116 [Dreissena polymorpha]
MGANERGVCVGCTAVWTKFCHPGDHEEKLIGCDFVRLALERSSTAREVVDVVTSLLAAHGQGGICCEDHNFGQWTYHSAFVAADVHEAWIVETAGKLWAARKVNAGVLATTSKLTIGTNADITSPDISAYAINGGFWKAEDGPIDFAKAFSSEYGGISLSEKQTPEHRLNYIVNCLNSTNNGKVDINKVFEILRNEESSINFVGELLTVGSQVSILPRPTSGAPVCHWFTATPNTKFSIFKPFMFCENPDIGKWTVSSNSADKPRSTFQTSVDRRHALFRAHEKAREIMESKTPVGEKIHATVRLLEKQCVTEVLDFVKTFKESNMNEVRELFNDIVESEIKFYS